MTTTADTLMNLGRARTTTKTTTIYYRWDETEQAWVLREKTVTEVEHDVPPITPAPVQYVPAPTYPQFPPAQQPPYVVGDPPFPRYPTVVSEVSPVRVSAAGSMQKMTDPYRGTGHPEFPK